MRDLSAVGHYLAASPTSYGCFNNVKSHDDTLNFSVFSPIIPRPPATMNRYTSGILSQTPALVSALQPLDSYYIPPDRINFDSERRLGYGGSRVVRVAILTEAHDSGEGTEERVVAVKQIHSGGNDEERVRMAKRFTRELKVWADMPSHPNILPLIGFYLSQDLEGAWLVSGYEPLGNIEEYISIAQPDGSARLGLVVDTAEGLAYLHKLNICHADIKAVRRESPLICEALSFLR